MFDYLRVHVRGDRGHLFDFYFIPRGGDDKGPVVLSLLFAAFRFRKPKPVAVVRARLEALRAWYDPHHLARVKTTFHYDPQTGVGFFALSQDYENERLRSVVETPDRIALLSDRPFGYSTILGACPPDEIGHRLVARLREAPALMGHMHPPLSVVEVDKKAGDIRLYADVIGLSKSFTLETEEGFVVSSRPLAAHFVMKRRPTASDLGWAMEQQSGWFFGEVTPFTDTRRNLGGAIIRIGGDGVSLQQQDLMGPIVAMRPDGTALFDAYDRMFRELESFGTFRDLRIALSGGRDSRATAAMTTRRLAMPYTINTNGPPMLEVLVARQLIERLDDFDRFTDDGRSCAVRADGSPLWAANIRSAVTRRMKNSGRRDFVSNAAQWAIGMEGLGLGPNCLNPCPHTSIFTDAPTRELVIHGPGGEIGRTHKYAPNRYRTIDQLRRYVSKTTPDEHYKIQRYTSRQKIDFARDEYWPEVQSHLDREWARSADIGLTGYNRFDHMYLVCRMTKASAGYISSDQVLFYLAPEFMSAAMNDSLERKHRFALGQDLVDHYQPSWSDVPYVDMLPAAPTSEHALYDPTELPWAGPHARAYRAILARSPALGEPYDRIKIDEHLEMTWSAPEGISAAMTFKGLGLVHRHAFVQMCKTVADRIATLND